MIIFLNGSVIYSGDGNSTGLFTLFLILFRSSWSLSWKASDGLLLNYTLRTEAGEGPLALLALRNFTLPETIFSVRAPAERVPLTDDIPGEEGS